MRAYEAITLGLRVTSNIRRIAAMYHDDQDRWVALSEAGRLTGIHRTTLLTHMSKTQKQARKFGHCWHLRLKLFTRIVETYRYGKLGTRNGRWWDAGELDILTQPLSHTEAAQLLNRSYNAVKVKRSKLCNRMN